MQYKYLKHTHTKLVNTQGPTDCCGTPHHNNRNRGSYKNKNILVV